MKRITYTCDKCGVEIKGVVYALTCYADDITAPGFGCVSTEVATQNSRQNLARMGEERQLCRACKDELTDGIFIL